MREFTFSTKRNPPQPRTGPKNSTQEQSEAAERALALRVHARHVRIAESQVARTHTFYGLPLERTDDRWRDGAANSRLADGPVWLCGRDGKQKLGRITAFSATECRCSFTVEFLEGIELLGGGKVLNDLLNGGKVLLEFSDADALTSAKVLP